MLNKAENEDEKKSFDSFFERYEPARKESLKKGLKAAERVPKKVKNMGARLDRRINRTVRRGTDEEVNRLKALKTHLTTLWQRVLDETDREIKES